jgi:hypothetical protein
MKINMSAVAATTIAGLSLTAAPRADAAYTTYLYQDGANVVATGAGSIDTIDLTATKGGFQLVIGVIPAAGFLGLGDSTNTDQIYTGASGPTSLGAGVTTDASTSSGEVVGVQGPVPAGQIFVPFDYVSGASLGTSTDVWDSTTLATMGLTDGVYTWTWGTGPDADSFTLDVGDAPPTSDVPEPTTLAILGTSLVGLALRRRRGTLVG